MRDPARIREMFTAISPRYDLLNRLLSAGLDVRWRRAAVRALDPRAGQTVLDLCGGTGDLSLELARAGCTAVCADFSGSMLRAAATKAARAGGARVRPVLADALRLPFADGAFDAVTVAFGLRNLRTVEAGLAEMIRVLRPGGTLAVLEFSTPRSAPLRLAYHLYLRGLLPLVGGLVSGRGSAYRYLARSIEEFPDQEELVRRMSRAGLADVTYRSLTGGIVALHLGRRVAPARERPVSDAGREAGAAAPSAHGAGSRPDRR